MLRRYVTSLVGRPKTVIAARRGRHADARLLHDPAAGAAGRRFADSARAPLVVVGKRVEKLFGGKYMTVIGFYPARARSTRRRFWPRSSA